MTLQNRVPNTALNAIENTSPRALHECRNAEEFVKCFESVTQRTVRQVIDQIVAPDAPRAVFLTGSHPLGMATSGSDVDFMVLVSCKDALLNQADSRIVNSEKRMSFTNDSDELRAGLFITVLNGMTTEVAAIVASSIKHVYRRLRSRGPELTESEIMTLGRLSTGWLLEETGNFLKANEVTLSDPTMSIYCSTRHFSYALIYRHKALAALALEDVPQALHLGRLSVEMAYLAYFASEGLTYLGPKWLAQLGHARGAAERARNHPMLKEHLHLLFPSFGASSSEGTLYLQAVSAFLMVMRSRIEKRQLFKIAFQACPTIYSVA